MANKYNYLILSLSLCVVSLYSMSSEAQYYNARPHDVERRLDRLERQIENMRAKIDRLEREIGNYQLPHPQPPRYQDYTCHITAAGFVYEATRPTREQATARALEKCRAVLVSLPFCHARNVTCDR